MYDYQILKYGVIVLIISSVSSCFGKKSVESQNQDTVLSGLEEKQIAERLELIRTCSIFHRILGVATVVFGAHVVLSNLSNHPDWLKVALGAGIFVLGVDHLKIGQAESKFVKAMHDKPQSFLDTFRKMIYLYKNGIWGIKKDVPYFCKDSWIIGPTVQFLEDLAYDLKMQCSDEMQLRKST